LFKSAVLLAAIAAPGISAAQAQEQSGSTFSIFLNAIPKYQNASVDDVPGSQNLNDKAYQYGVSYTWGPKDKSGSAVRAEYDYVSVRRLRFINRYVDAALGASEEEGIAILYGQRYMITGSGYGGFGAGWYAGVFTGNERWVEKGITTTPREGTLAFPLGSGEVFYKWNVLKNLFVEPSLLLAWNSKAEGNSGFQLMPQLLIGAQF
jgi:hypothetical protein